MKKVSIGTFGHSHRSVNGDELRKMKKRVAIIGAGISGLTVGQRLQPYFDVTVFEKSSAPGGLIKCKRVDGNLYHMVGGHVFNSKRKDVLDYFWSLFDRETEFISAKRNAAINLDGFVGYPIENHLYQLDAEIAESVIDDLIRIETGIRTKPESFGEFLEQRFGRTLYDLYFRPYNEKVWKEDLSKVPLSWLAGKLPMPTVREIILNNLIRADESKMVHSSFYYPKVDGSQFLVDRFSKGLDILCRSEISNAEWSDSSKSWNLGSQGEFDIIVFAGNIKSLPRLLGGSFDSGMYVPALESLSYHGTTTVLCEIEKNPYSWIYLPDSKILAHRIINTGNFSKTNNGGRSRTATVEITGKVDFKDIIKDLGNLPYNPKYIEHVFTEFTYPIQDHNTRPLISEIKETLGAKNLFITGRFAEWEYYNMDAAIGAAMDLSSRLVSSFNVDE